MATQYHPWEMQFGGQAFEVYNATWKPAGRYPIIANTVFSSVENALNYAKNDPTAYAGAVIGIHNEVDKTENGVYYIAAIGSKYGEIKKLGEEGDSISKLKERLDILIDVDENMSARKIAEEAARQLLSSAYIAKGSMAGVRSVKNIVDETAPDTPPTQEIYYSIPNTTSDLISCTKPNSIKNIYEPQLGWVYNGSNPIRFHANDSDYPVGTNYVIIQIDYKNYLKWMTKSRTFKDELNTSYVFNDDLTQLTVTPPANEPTPEVPEPPVPVPVVFTCSFKDDIITLYNADFYQYDIKYKFNIIDKSNLYFTLIDPMNPVEGKIDYHLKLSTTDPTNESEPNIGLTWDVLAGLANLDSFATKEDVEKSKTTLNTIAPSPDVHVSIVKNDTSSTDKHNDYTIAENDIASAKEVSDFKKLFNNNKPNKTLISNGDNTWRWGDLPGDILPGKSIDITEKRINVVTTEGCYDKPITFKWVLIDPSMETSSRPLILYEEPKTPDEAALYEKLPLTYGVSVKTGDGLNINEKGVSVKISPTETHLQLTEEGLATKDLDAYTLTWSEIVEEKPEEPTPDPAPDVPPTPAV